MRPLEFRRVRSEDARHSAQSVRAAALKARTETLVKVFRMRDVPDCEGEALNAERRTSRISEGVSDELEEVVLLLLLKPLWAAGALCLWRDGSDEGLHGVVGLLVGRLLVGRGPGWSAAAHGLLHHRYHVLRLEGLEELLVDAA